MTSIKKRALLILLGCGVFLFEACELLQNSLSSELKKKLEAETGVVSINGSVWYYPGAADMDMSLTPKAELALNISKQAAVLPPKDPSKPSGLTGAFQITYMNSAGRQSISELPFKGGHFNGDYTIFYLDTSSLADVLNPALNPSGKGLLELTISGFVNNEDGEQKGRPLPPFTRTVDFEPLFPSRNIYFSSRTPVRGRSIEIPLNAPVTLSPTADFVITGGTNYPRGLFDADFELSLSPGGSSILLSPKQELYDQEFDFSVNIMGIIPPLSSMAAECTFNVYVTNSLVILDGVKDAVWDSPETAYAADPVGDAYSGGYVQPGNEISGLYVLSDLNNLYVAFEFASLSNFWEEDRIAILIDKAGVETGDTTESLARVTSVPKLSSAMTIQNGTAYIYFVHIPGAARGKGNSMLRRAADVVENDLSGNPVRVRASRYGWSNPNGPLFLEYRFGLGDLGLATGDQIRVLGVLSNHWDSDDSIHCTDTVPGGTQADSRNAIYDFNTGLALTLGEGPAYVAPQPDDMIPPPPPSWLVVSEKGSNGVKFKWAAQFNAGSYLLYRSAGADGGYEALPQIWTGTSGVDWDVSEGAAWFYKAASVNLAGPGPMTAAIRVEISGPEISKYSTVNMTSGNGVLDDAFMDPLGADSSKDSRPPGGPGNYDIKGLYVTNDASYLYIALDFGSSPPKGYNNDRITVVIDNAADNGSAAFNGNSKPATTTAGAAGANLIVSKLMNGGWAANPGDVTISYNTANGSWPQDAEWFRSPGVNVIKIRIPASGIGNPSEGTQIRVFAAFCEGWDEGNVFVRGIIPRAAAPGAAVNTETITIDMSRALIHPWY